MGKKVDFKKEHVVLSIVMVILAILMLYPFVMMVTISIRNSGSAYKGLFDPSVIHTLRNYRTVLSNKYFPSWYMNTIVTVTLTIVMRLIITIAAAYAFARLKFKGSKWILSILIATMMVPGETTMVPRYLWYKSIGIIDSFWCIVLPEMSEIFYLILLIEFFQSIPEDFTEAAKIDGAGHVRIMAEIFVPLSGPSITTTILFSFINIWNNYLDPYLFIKTIDRQLITPALQFFQQQGGANVPVQLAGSTLALIPVILLFIFTQKYFIAGVSSSGIKG